MVDSMQYDWCSYKRRRAIQSEAEIGMTQLQANTGQGFLGVTRTYLGQGLRQLYQGADH